MSHPDNRPSRHPAPSLEPAVLAKRGKFPLALHWTELRGAISESALSKLTPEARAEINQLGAVCPVCNGVTPCRDIQPAAGTDGPVTTGHDTFLDRHSVGGPAILRCKRCNASARLQDRADWTTTSAWVRYKVTNSQAYQLRRDTAAFRPCDVCGGTGLIKPVLPPKKVGSLTNHGWQQSVRKLHHLAPETCDEPNYPAWRALIKEGLPGDSTEAGREFLSSWCAYNESLPAGVPTLCPLCRLTDRVVPVVSGEPYDADVDYWERQAALVVESPDQRGASGFEHHHYCGRCQVKF